MAEICEDCGQPKATKLEQVDDKSGFCWRNPRACRQTLPWRKKVADLSAQLASAQAELKRRWIRASDRIPASTDAVIVVNNGKRELAWRSTVGWYGQRDALLTGVTHWMPMPSLPEPPKASET